MIDRSCDISQAVESLNDNEQMKARSRYLRGDIAKGLTNTLTGAVPGNDTLLMKFHGIYQQDNRDVRSDRARRKLEPIYQFMVRMRIPGGILSKEQWLGIDALSRQYADRGIRITSRQTVQLHGIRKTQLRSLMQGIRDIGLDTIAACGDDSRGVVCGNNPVLPKISRQVSALAKKTSDYLIPRTKAYAEIWYDSPAATSPQILNATEDPLYGPLYLPRKFKVGFAIPPGNDIDVYGQDLGFIAVVREDRLLGFNVCVGGGMGKLDTREDSYPRLAEQIGFIEAAEVPRFAELVMSIQRDFGDRKDRHRARFKYTLDRLGTHWFIDELALRRGKELAPAMPIIFTHNNDYLGWQQGKDGLWHACLYIENGRIDGPLRDQIEAFLHQYGGSIRLTTNQNLQLIDINSYEKEQAHWRLNDLGLGDRLRPSLQAAHTLSCVALPTCGLAMAEAERYMPDLLELINRLKHHHGLSTVPISLRVTGCPNGCARPFLGEIALTGRAPGIYNLYLGGSFHGDRLAKLYASNVNENRFIALLDPLLARFAAQRNVNEYFGDFLLRKNLLDSTPLEVRQP